MLKKTPVPKSKKNRNLTKREVLPDTSEEKMVAPSRPLLSSASGGNWSSE
jgi:hypothetical protein